MKTEKGETEKFTFDPPSKGYVVSKPIQQESYDEKVIRQLEKEKNLIITRKRNGWKLFAIKANGFWKIYTDGLNEVHCLDHVKRDLEKLEVGNNSKFDCEGILNINDNDDFRKGGAILHAGKEKAPIKRLKI